jgi:DNA-binding response OmpR family regulator
MTTGEAPSTSEGEKIKILYVEDDETLSFVTKDNLEMQGYAVMHRPDGKSGLEAFTNESFDICILDVMLPELDGFSLAREIRKRDAQVPILFLTAKTLKEDKISGLQLGADDYIVKPFSIVELLLKIQVFIRRSKGISSSPSVYRIGQFELDFENLKLRHREKVADLTLREAELLRHFANNKNKVLKRSEILEKIWGKDDYFLGRSLDVFVSRLRKYLKDDPSVEIENIHSVGFRLNM